MKQKSLRLMPILMAIIMVFTMMPVMGGAVYADGDSEKTFESNGVTYTLTVDANNNKVVSVTGCDWYLTGGVEILDKVEFDGVEYPVTSIGSGAFPFTNITSITIPASVTSIGENAFNECRSLGTVAFAEGSKLESIGNFAFQASAITSITIPASVTSIGQEAFCVCGSLGTVAFAEGSKLESIGGEAFRSTAITSITIPASVTSIGGSAFRETAITSITIPASVTSIEECTFLDCKSLETVTFAEGSKLESIGGGAFESTAITSITIPASVTSIEDYAFNCEGLSTVYYVGTKDQWDGMTGRDEYWAGGRDVRVICLIYEPKGKTLTYNGKSQTGVTAGEGYTLSGTTSATNAGTYTAKATLKEGYEWADGSSDVKLVNWKINKADNPLSIKGKNVIVKKSKVKKKAQKLSVGKVITFTKKGQGKMTYTLVSAKKGSKSFKKKFAINKTTGKVTVKKGLKKGTYKVKVKVKAAGNANYKASAWKTVTFKIKVK